MRRHHRRTPRLGAATLISLISVLVVSGAAAVTPFVNETLQSSGDVGAHCDLAIDDRGHSHVSYYDVSNGDLEYGTNKSGTWTFEIVDSALDTGQATSIALDAAGNPHISYYAVDDGDLRYAVKVSGSWTLETVASTGDVGDNNSLVLDEQGNPHIAYRNTTTQELHYATKSGGSWTLELVDTSGPTGISCSIALDDRENPGISYSEAFLNDLRYAFKSNGVWYTETVGTTNYGSFTSLAIGTLGFPRIAARFAGCTLILTKTGSAWSSDFVECPGGGADFPSLVLDANDNARVSHHAAGPGELRYWVKSGGSWSLDQVDGNASHAAGQYSALALDAEGNPRIAHYDPTHGNLEFSDSSIHLTAPAAGATWPVGSLRTVSWTGAGTVDVLLSVDGGDTWEILADEVGGNSVELLVPHAPTNFARIKVERGSPFSSSKSDSLFTIESSIALISFTAGSSSERGVFVQWSTDPGPVDLGGYRLDRAGTATGDWIEIVSLTRATSHLDPSGDFGSRYRLTAVNGLGEETVLGESAVLPAAALAAWPLPYRGGELAISFATFRGLLGGAGPAAVSIYDVSGRLVRTVASGAYPAGLHSATWDGRDGEGRHVTDGVYFLRSATGGTASTMKLVVVR